MRKTSPREFIAMFSILAAVCFTSVLSFAAKDKQTDSQAQSPAKKYQVTTSFSILKDLTEQIATPDFQISALVGLDQDAHSYQPKPSDLKLMLKSNLFISNGLGFETWANKLLTSGQYKGRAVIATTGLVPLSFGINTKDPHAWQNPANMSIYLNQIANALIAISPENKSTIEKNTATYLKKILTTHEKIRVKYLTLPIEKRRVITTHGAFQYYGKAYGIEFLSAQGISTESDPSAKTLARLIQQIRKENIHCLFLETASNPKLLQQIQSETKAKIGGTLHSDSLSKNGARTYLEMMESNFQQIYSCLSNQISVKIAPSGD
jgi:zinc/manganese transport system substrate-binding protein